MNKSILNLSRRINGSSSMVMKNSFGMRKFHQSSGRLNSAAEGAQQQSSGYSRSSFYKRMFFRSLIASVGISSAVFLLAIREYKKEPMDSSLDRFLKTFYGPYRNYVKIESDQPEIEDKLIYSNELLSIDISNSEKADDNLANLFIKPGLLIKEELQSAGGKFEVFDDYGHNLDLIWVLMSRDEYTLAQENPNDVNQEKTKEKLLNSNDLIMLETSIKKGLSPDEEVVWMERINAKNELSSKEYSSLPEGIKQKPNCVLAIIKTPNAYSHSSDYFTTRYGDVGKKVKSTPNGDLYRGLILASHYNYLLALGRSYPNQMINFDLARKDLNKQEIEQVLSFVPESQKASFAIMGNQSTSKSYEIIRKVRDTILDLYVNRLKLNSPEDETKK